MTKFSLVTCQDEKIKPSFSSARLCVVTVGLFTCAEIVRQKGLENITVDDLVAEITPKGRGKHTPD